MPQITQLPDIFTSQLFWLTVFFGLIFFGIGLGMLPKIRSTLDARGKKIAEDIQAAKAARAAAEKTEAEWRLEIENARQRAAQAAQEAKRQSAREMEARLNKALEEIDAKVEAARIRIRAALEAAQSEMEAVATEAAQQMVEQLTDLKVDRKDAAKAIATEYERLNGTVAREQAAPIEANRTRVASGAR